MWDCQELGFLIRALNAPVSLGEGSPVSHGHVWGIYKSLQSSLLSPYVFVVGPNKHGHFHPSQRPSGNSNRDYYHDYYQS